MADGPDSQKQETLQRVRDYKAAAGQAKSRGQDFVRHAHGAEESAGLVEEAMQNLPDDTYRSEADWQSDIKFFADGARRLESFSVDMVQIEHMASSTNVAVSDVLLLAAPAPALPLENQDRAREIGARFAEFLKVRDRDPDLEAHLVRLELDTARDPANRDAVHHYRQAHDDLVKPSADQPDPGAVLLGIRSCFARAILDLLQRRPHPHKDAPSWDAKVRSICTCFGKDGLETDQVDRLARDAGKLHKRLSAAGKDKALSPAETQTLFLEATNFLKSLLVWVDESLLT